MGQTQEAILTGCLLQQKGHSYRLIEREGVLLVLALVQRVLTPCPVIRRLTGIPGS